MYKHLQRRDTGEKPVSVSTLAEMKQQGEKIACLTAYDASFAALVDEARVDFVLVGDSLGMVIQGYETTVPVTVDDIVYHTRAVSAGLSRAFLIADMPFMSYTNAEEALKNAARMMQEGGAKMVKLESAVGQAGIVEKLTTHDVPVCAHIGLRPQSVHKLGGMRVQGREKAAARQMLADAKALENAGADVVLLECLPSELGARIAAELSVPVIGIGAGPDVDGQILVLYDILNITLGRTPRFAKNFMDAATTPQEAVADFVKAVKDGSYPAPEHCFS